MFVTLSPDMVITSFYSTIAEKIREQGEDFCEIFKVRFKPERIIDFAQILKHYEDVIGCFNEKSLIHSFENEWGNIFYSDEDGYIRLRENKQLTTVNDDYARRIVAYLVHQMRMQLNNYPLGFLRKAGIL